MLINIFKSNQKVISLLVLFLSILLWIPSFWVDQSSVINQNLSFHISNKIIVFVVASIIIGLQAIYLNYIVNEFKLLSSQTHLPALLFIILNAGISTLMVFSPLLIVNILILIAFHQMLLMYNQNNAFAISFNIGFLIAIATLIYFPVILIFLLLWIALLYTKSPNWRELVIAVLGFSVPVMFYVAYYFLTDQLSHLITFGWGGYRIFNLTAIPSSLLARSFFITLLLIGLFASLNLFKAIAIHVVKIKKHLILVILLFLLLLSTLLLNSKDYLATYTLLTVPIAIVIASFLNNIKKKWLTELVFSLLLISILVGYFS